MAERTYTLLTRPLTEGEILQRADSDNCIEGVVPIDLEFIIDSDLEAFLDDLSVSLVGSELLMDIQYGIVGFEGEELHIKVRGDASEVLKGA